MSAVFKDTEDVAANDNNYFLTPDKAKDQRRLATVKAKNRANARVFKVGDVYMTVREIAAEINSSQGEVSKEIKRMRNRGMTRFLLTDFKSRPAANDDLIGAMA